MDCQRGDKGSRDQKDRSPCHEQGWRTPPTTIVALQVAGEEDVTICHKWCSTSTLMMPEVLFGEINLQLSKLKLSVLKNKEFTSRYLCQCMYKSSVQDNQPPHSYYKCYYYVCTIIVIRYSCKEKNILYYNVCNWISWQILNGIT